MRKIINKILTALPGFFVTLVGLYFIVKPEKARVCFNYFSQKINNATYFYTCIILLLLYMIIWIATAIEPKSRRQRIQEGLRPYRSSLQEAQDALLSARNKDELDEIVRTKLEPSVMNCAEWIQQQMGDAALRKYSAATFTLLTYNWPGNSEQDAKYRNSLLTINDGRIAILDQFLQSDAWDGAPMSIRRQLTAQR